MPQDVIAFGLVGFVSGGVLGGYFVGSLMADRISHLSSRLIERRLDILELTEDLREVEAHIPARGPDGKFVRRVA